MSVWLFFPLQFIPVKTGIHDCRKSFGCQGKAGDHAIHLQASKYMTTVIPFRYETHEKYETTELSGTLLTHATMTAPKVVTRLGTIINHNDKDWPQKNKKQTN